jgi:AAA domain
MKVVAVVNNKGGVGKTTVTANLGAGLAHTGKRVLMIDLDPQASLTKSFFTVDHHPHGNTDTHFRPADGGSAERWTPSRALRRPQRGCAPNAPGCRSLDCRHWARSRETITLERVWATNALASGSASGRAEVPLDRLGARRAWRRAQPVWSDRPHGPTLQ